MQLHCDVNQVLLRYASAVDHKVPETLAALFTPDAAGHYYDRLVYRQGRWMISEKEFQVVWRESRTRPI